MVVLRGARQGCIVMMAAARKQSDNLKFLSQPFRPANALRLSRRLFVLRTVWHVLNYITNLLPDTEAYNP